MLQRTSIRASLLSGSCAAAVLCLGASTAKATITFNFDENGNGTVTGPAGNTTPLTSLGNQVDPVDPGNGLLPLVYRMPSIGGVLPVPGDVDVLEPATPAGLHSDLLRWANSSVGPL